VKLGNKNDRSQGRTLKMSSTLAILARQIVQFGAATPGKVGLLNRQVLSGVTGNPLCRQNAKLKKCEKPGWSCRQDYCRDGDEKGLVQDGAAACHN
jgi:hypothetical protein